LLLTAALSLKHFVQLFRREKGTRRQILKVRYKGEFLQAGAVKNPNLALLSEEDVIRMDVAQIQAFVLEAFHDAKQLNYKTLDLKLVEKYRFFITQPNLLLETYFFVLTLDKNVL